MKIPDSGFDVPSLKPTGSRGTLIAMLVMPSAPNSPSLIRIALTGKSGCGKTELANFLVQELALQRCSTGDIYRQFSRILFGKVQKDFMNRITVALRAMDPNCVLDAALRSAQANRGVVFDSMRFKEDHAFFRLRGFLLVRIESHAEIRCTRLLSRGEIQSADDFRALDRDKSETDLDQMDFDLVVTNNNEDVQAFVHDACHAIVRSTRV